MNENEYEYIKNSFTKVGENTNLEVNNLNVSCITSKNNKFELDADGNLTVNSIVAKGGLPNGGMSGDILDIVYPIGSIYLTLSANDPNAFFGGTWVQIAKGRTLVGVDTEQTEFEKVNKTGGEKNHVLTADEMPRHSHTIFGRVDRHQGSGEIFREPTEEGEGVANHTAVGNSGGSLAHNNLQPYLTCYIWNRTA